MSDRLCWHQNAIPQHPVGAAVDLRSLSWALTLVCLLTGSSARSQEFDERFDDWPIDLRIKGRVAAVCDLQHLNLLTEFVASDSDKVHCLVVCEDGDATDVMAAYQDLFSDVATCSIEQLISMSTDSIPNHVALQTKTISRQQQREASVLLKQLLSTGHTIISAGAAAQRLGKHRVAANSEQALGLNLFPDCILQLDFESSDRTSLLSAMAANPRSVGLGLPSNSALVLDGRKLRVAGSGSVTLMLMANELIPLRIETIAARSSPRQPTTEWLADLTQWRREAIDRTLEPFPAQSPAEPRVDAGTLLIVGGGGMPDGLMQRFVELAGGAEAARLVYVPCAEDEEIAERQTTVLQWRKMGVERATTFHTKDRRKANEDDEFLRPLKDATGIWFGGGRQWNFADSYYGTQAHRLMKDVLKRGGVIGGSSAGASIQARYLARATPIENDRIMAPGYERGGLGFLSGVAIDQHFSQRGRLPDMSQLVNRHPQLLGIGIDEATAIEVHGSLATIVGKGGVYFYDRRQPVVPGQADYSVGREGQVYDLVERKFK